MIIAEREFTIQDDAKLRGVQLNIPAFTSRGEHLKLPKAEEWQIPGSMWKGKLVVSKNTR